jgi:hypothetical protein
LRWRACSQKDSVGVAFAARGEANSVGGSTFVKAQGQVHRVYRQTQQDFSDFAGLVV